MKCQKCDKTATFHITELVKGSKAQEVHLCEDHAREYLAGGEQESNEPMSLANELAQQLGVGQTAEELSRLDQRACPICGITFYEFRNQGRLGCPHDYVCFEKELEPLMINVHGETAHVGKRPHRFPQGTDQQTDLIRMRRELKEAVQKEEYEKASELRDSIRKLETQGRSAS